MSNSTEAANTINPVMVPKFMTMGKGLPYQRCQKPWLTDIVLEEFSSFIPEN